MAMTTILATAAAGARAAGRGARSFMRGLAPPGRIGRPLTVSGTASHNGDWVNAYICYSDGTWEILGGSVGSSRSFSLSGVAQSFSGLAPSGDATVQIYAGSANNLMKMETTTCSFSVS
jgi:hypothetical protein